MPASKYDFTIEQGSSYQITFIYKDANNTPIDLTTWCARIIAKTNKVDTTVQYGVVTSNTIQVLDPVGIMPGASILAPRTNPNIIVTDVTENTVTLSASVTLSAGVKIGFSGAELLFSSENTDTSKYSFILNDSPGSMTLLLPAETTDSFNFSYADYDLDLKSAQPFTEAGDPYTIRILYGRISIMSRASYTGTDDIC